MEKQGRILYPTGYEWDLPALFYTRCGILIRSNKLRFLQLCGANKDSKELVYTRLIDADAFSAVMKQRQDAVKEWMSKGKDEETCAKAGSAYVMLAEVKLLLDQMPTIDVVETKHGVWNPISHSDVCTCSVCGDYIDNAKYYRYNYCPNCGAEMSFEEA